MTGLGRGRIKVVELLGFVNDEDGDVEGEGERMVWVG